MDFDKDAEIARLGKDNSFLRGQLISFRNVMRLYVKHLGRVLDHLGVEELPDFEHLEMEPLFEEKEGGEKE